MFKTLASTRFAIPPNIHNLKNLRTFYLGRPELAPFVHYHWEDKQPQNIPKRRITVNGTPQNTYNAWHMVDNLPTAILHLTLKSSDLLMRADDYISMCHHPQAHITMLSNLEILTIIPRADQLYNKYNDLCMSHLTYSSLIVLLGIFPFLKNLKALLWYDSFGVCSFYDFLETFGGYASVPNLQYLRIPIEVDISGKRF